jgi:non-heme chloroperoxidase
MTDTIHIVANDGVKLAVRRSGDGPRRTLFIHGWMASSRTWDFLLPHLDTAGLSVAKVDLRGTGASDKPASGYTLERYGQDLLAVVDQLGWDRFTVVAHSMGGQLAQWLATRAPARVEALCAICPVPASGLAMPPEAISLFSSAGGDEAKLGMILKLATQHIGSAEKQQLLDDARAQPAACINEGFLAFSQGFSADLATVRARTLVIATDDPFLPLPLLKDAVCSRIPHARLAYLPGAGHYPQHERARETAALITAFLAGLGT